MRDLIEEEPINRLDCSGKRFRGKVLLQKTKIRRFAEVTERFQKIGRLAILSVRLLQHVEQIPQLAEQTTFEDARTCRMVKRQVPHERDEFEELKKRVGEGVGDVCFQPGECGLVVEPASQHPPKS